jgi:hypothetical protein
VKIGLAVVDRLTNLLTLAAFAVAFAVGASALYDAWRTVAPWEQEWIVIPGKEPKYASEQLLAGMHKASDLGEFDDANTFEVALRSDFMPMGKVLVRFNNAELFSAATSFAAALLLLLVPLSVNYLRHGAFRLWNRGA